MNSSKIRIFISYAKEDAKVANRLYKDLKQAGLDPWLDVKSLLPGNKWENTIKQTIRSSNYFIALLSSNSVTKRGFVQKEIKEALNFLDEFPEQEIFIIPVRLNECIPSHERLRALHWVDMFPTWEEGINKILSVIRPESIDLKIIKGLMSEKGSTILSSYSKIDSRDKAKYYEELLNIMRKSSSTLERLAALEGLIIFPNKDDLVFPLLELTKDPSNAIRRRAVFHLGQIGARSAIGAISALLSDKSPDVRAAARDAYRKIKL